MFILGFMKGSHKADVELARFSNEAKELAIKLKDEQNNIKEKIVTEYVDKIQTVKEKQYVYVKQATEVVPSQYYLSNGWVYHHDYVASAQGGNADNARIADASPSDIKDNQALATVVDNYGTCKQNAEQLIALQDYIKRVKDSVDKANAAKAERR
jgi:hypothetical protein